MATAQVIPFRDEPRFTQRVRLGARFYRLRHEYLTRVDRWALSIHDDDDVALLDGKKLVVGANLLEFHGDPALPPGALVVFDTGLTYREPGRNDFRDGNHLLMYFDGVTGARG